MYFFSNLSRYKKLKITTFEKKFINLFTGGKKLQISIFFHFSSHFFVTYITFLLSSIIGESIYTVFTFFIEGNILKCHAVLIFTLALTVCLNPRDGRLLEDYKSKTK